MRNSAALSFMICRSAFWSALSSSRSTFAWRAILSWISWKVSPSSGAALLLLLLL